MKAPILLHTAEIQNKSSRQLYDEIVSLPVIEQCNKSNCCYSSTQQHPSSYSNRFSWIHPPTPHIKETLAEYIKCKALNSNSTTACFLIPKYGGNWRRKLKKMTLLKSYAVGDCLPCPHGTFISKIHMELWLDKPTKMQCKSLQDDSQDLLMTFNGQVAVNNGHINAQILVDSGATHCFVSSEFAERHKLVLQPDNGSVVCAGNIQARVCGHTYIRLKIQGFPSQAKAYVIELESGNGVDLILGQTWLSKYNARIDYEKQYVLYQLNGQQCILQCSKGKDAHSSLMTCLSFAQIKRAAANSQTRMFAIHLNPVEAKDEFNLPRLPQAQELINEFMDVFQTLPSGLPPMRTIGHTINTGDNPPVSKSAYRLSPKEKEEVESQVKELLSRGLIRPSKSPYGSPVIFVQKKDGSLRMCIDYRAVNKLTVKDKYPLPRIDDLVDRLKDARFFSSLDLQSGYHQIRIADQDIEKTAFRTHEGLYEFMVLPFGLTNAPAAFQREMKVMFDSLPFVLVYLDDILIYSKTAEEHKLHLREALQLLRDNKLYAKLKKCEFFQEKAKFLGHIIGKDGIEADPEKISAVQKWPAPQDVQQLKSFLGLANHMKSFIKDYSLMAASLHNLTKPQIKFDFESNPAAVKAFAQIKEALCNAPVLAIADDKEPFELVCDACGFGIGAVLMQHGKPVAFYSYKLNSAERNYPTGEQELLAVVKSLQHWRYHLEGCSKLTVVTDHKPNTFLTSKPAAALSRRQVGWQTTLSRFDFDWEYRKGAYNIADPLSRNPSLLMMTVSQQMFSQTSASMIEEIKSGYDKDIWFTCVENVKDLHFQEGLWTKSSKLVVPNVGQLRARCIAMHHDPPYAGHVGRDRTKEILSRHFWWPKLHEDVADFVSKCDMCQRNKAANQKPAGLLQSLQIPKGMWSSVSMDLITQLPETNNHNTAIVVFVDRLSKMAILAAVKTSISAKEFAHVFMDKVCSRFGVPDTIVSDRDPRFTSAFFKEVCLGLDIRQNMSTAFHPQTDGQTERMNRVLEEMLRSFGGQSMKTWDLHLPMCEFAINNAFNESIRNTPFFLNYGRHPRTPSNISAVEIGSSPSSWKEHLTNLQDARSSAQRCLSSAQMRQAKYANRRRRELFFEVGDFVLLDAKNIRFRVEGPRKLLHRFLGPFEILKKVGKLAYELRLPPNMEMHDVFHVSLLRPYKRGEGAAPPPAVLPDSELEYEVEAILGHEDDSDNERFFQVKWTGHDVPTWESEIFLQNCKKLIADYFKKSGKSKTKLRRSSRRTSAGATNT